jgi:hypothetical protein
VIAPTASPRAASAKLICSAHSASSQSAARLIRLLHQGDVGEVAQPAFGRHRRGRTQGQAAGAVGQHKAEQIDGGFDLARARERAVGTR